VREAFHVPHLTAPRTLALRTCRLRRVPSVMLGILRFPLPYPCAFTGGSRERILPPRNSLCNAYPASVRYTAQHSALPYPPSCNTRLAALPLLPASRTLNSVPRARTHATYDLPVYKTQPTRAPTRYAGVWWRRGRQADGCLYRYAPTAAQSGERCSRRAVICQLILRYADSGALGEEREGGRGSPFHCSCATAFAIHCMGLQQPPNTTCPGSRTASHLSGHLPPPPIACANIILQHTHLPPSMPSPPFTLPCATILHSCCLHLPCLASLHLPLAYTCLHTAAAFFSYSSAVFHCHMPMQATPGVATCSVSCHYLTPSFPRTCY